MTVKGSMLQRPSKFEEWAEKAVYRKQTINAYCDNPFIEALPDILDPETANDLLAVYPEYCETDRQKPTEMRQHLIRNAVRFFDPSLVHQDIEERFSGLIRMGYVGRNPIGPSFFPEIRRRVEFMRKSTSYERCYGSTAFGFAILGLPGVGKTSAVEAVLSLYPQIIIHEQYMDRLFSQIQIVHLTLQCPYDGSIRGLCFSFFQEIDKLLGTNYYDRYTRHGRATKDEMMPHMANLASLLGIGVIVIDEVQNLVRTKTDSADHMIRFFVQLINTISIPVVFVGTYEAREVLSGALHQIRRVEGQGDLIWERMQEDAKWDHFIQALWRYQYTQISVELTPTLSHTLYDQSQGITDFAVKVYMLAQIEAITKRKEQVTEKLIEAAAQKHLRLAQPVLDALRIGTAEELLKQPQKDIYIDLDDDTKETVASKAPKQMIGTTSMPSTPTPHESSAVKERQKGKLSPGASQEQKNTSMADAPEPNHSLSKSILQEVISSGKTSNVDPYQALKAEKLVVSGDEFLNDQEIA